MKITVAELKELTAKALKNGGYTDKEIPVISDALLYAQLRGNNQGVVKLIGAGMPKSPDAGDMKIVKETGISARLDGAQNQAMVVMKKAVDITLEKAKANGFGIVGTFNTSTSSGAIGHYTAQLAEAGFVGFAFARSPERVAAHGSYEPVFGTDPLSIAIPTGSTPIVLDMSTAAISYFGLIEANTAGETIADDLVYDSEGNATTDPAAGMKGAIRSFDRSYKGTGLGMMAEILAGPLVGAAFSGIGNSKKNWGHLIYAIDPDILGDREEFIQNVIKMVEKVKGSKKLPGFKDLFVPGERGYTLAQKTIDSGEIEIEGNLLEGLKKAAE